jgi:Na+/citrate or Na+/malate symporter
MESTIPVWAALIGIAVSFVVGIRVGWKVARAMLIVALPLHTQNREH